MAKTEDEGESSNTKVCSNIVEEELTELNKSQLVKLLLKSLDDYKAICVKKEQVEKCLKRY